MSYIVEQTPEKTEFIEKRQKEIDDIFKAVYVTDPPKDIWLRKYSSRTNTKNC